MPKAVQSSFCETDVERLFGGWVMLLGEKSKIETKRRILVLNHAGEVMYR